MQPKTITVQIDADDALPFGLWNDFYVQFKDGDVVEPVEPEAVFDAYVEAAAKVPVEFGEVRILIEDKIAQLQALL